MADVHHVQACVCDVRVFVGQELLSGAFVVARYLPMSTAAFVQLWLTSLLLSFGCIGVVHKTKQSSNYWILKINLPRNVSAALQILLPVLEVPLTTIRSRQGVGLEDADCFHVSSCTDCQHSAART